MQTNTELTTGISGKQKKKSSYLSSQTVGAKRLKEKNLNGMPKPKVLVTYKAGLSLEKNKKK